jgi:predicted ribosomally synthesized peptide with SipW-like signal peptide
MARSRKFLTVGALGVASFALIGAGATATFNDSVQARQTITAGAMNMTIDSTAKDSWSNGKTLTLKAEGPVNSTFSTGAQAITVTNHSNIDAKMVKLAVSAPGNNGTLAAELYVKISVDDAVVYNNLLSKLEGFAAPLITGQTIAAGSHMTADVTFYAGSENSPSLSDGAQGGSVTPTFKVSFTG